MDVLAVACEESCPPGTWTAATARLGHRLVEWHPVRGDGAPAGPRRATIVLGGSMNVGEDHAHPWLAGVEALLRRDVEDGLPVLGVCLGAQLLASALGAWVGPASGEEVGWLDVELTAAGRDDPVVGALPPRFTALQWHRYAFAVPGGAVELARSPVCPQAFRRGRAWGVQFHPEVDTAIVRAWVEEDGVEPEPLLRETGRRIGEWVVLGERLLGAFLREAAVPSV